MDNGIVEGFQNLHVLPDCEAVDSMTRELANLLDESSPRLHRKAHCRHGDVGPTAGCVTRHPLKKRRCKKRKSASKAGPVVVTNASEGLDGGNTSDSSGGGGTLTRHIYMDCVSRLSDSDGLTVSYLSGAIPAAVNTTVVESDSVTENWSPLRPQRRRRHLRRMVVDDLCDPCDDVSILRCLNSSQSNAHRSSDHAHLLIGKRKRVIKDKSDNNSFDFDTINDAVVKMQ
jgi:G patch domain-containing protein 2